ncbi:hypothetical protein D9M71_47050 [compost metagenome]
MAMGRPPIELEDRLESGWQDRMRSLAAEGASELEVRHEMGISEHLWYKWTDENPDFSRTRKECQELCRIWWEKHGRKMSDGSADGNATVWIFNMKNRFGWKDKVETEHTGTIAFTDMTDDELDRRIAALKAAES